ncbi:ATPase [Aquaspirillum serpens]|uniref:ATPase n=1 Tax=Aquaspirillum serpens TaxID=190 RepID=UPI0003B62CC6|nr:ATPase [Aquaspirillum serpens]
MKNTLTTVTRLSNADWLNNSAWLQDLVKMPQPSFEKPSPLSFNSRLIRVDEINEEGHQAYRQALANVYATLDSQQAVRFLYLLCGSASGVELYFGVVSDTNGADVHEAMKNLRGALEGQLTGINFGDDVSPEKREALFGAFRSAPQQGVMFGAPTGQDDNNEEDSFQGLDRLVRALQSSHDKNTQSEGLWKLAVISQPLGRSHIRQLLDSAYELSSRLTTLVKTSIQSSDNISHQKSSSIGSSQAHGTNESEGSNWGKNESRSDTENQGISSSTTRGESKSWSKNHGSSTTESFGTSSSTNEGSSTNKGKTEGGAKTTGKETKNSGISVGTTTTTGTSTSQNTGHSTTRTSGTNDGGGSNTSTSHSQNSGTSTSKTHGISSGTSTNKGSSFTTTFSHNESVSDTEGKSMGITQEIANKRAQHLVDYLDKQLIVRLQKGLTKGLFHTAVYLAADNNSTYQRLKKNLCATFQGSETTLSPLEIYDLPAEVRGQFLRLPNIKPKQTEQELLFHSLQKGAHGTLGSLLTADELAIVASLPQRELQGIRRRKTVDFAVDLPAVADSEGLDLGAVIDRGRQYPKNRVRLARSDLNKHVFITGVTGAGKTTTCLNLLLESGLPFLVIEPAKTEYRALAEGGLEVEYYRPNGDQYQSFRLNPFALVRKGQRIKSHAGFLKNAFAAVFPMEASMPMMVEAAILAAYEEKGWDLDENEYLLGDNPFDPQSDAWPTMSLMIEQLDRLIPTYGLGKEFEEKYRGSLVSRLRSLTDGTLGRVLDVPQSMDFHSLLTRHSVIELEELQSGEEKALIMAFLLGAINETMRDHHAKNPNFRQLTLIEEAHRLLSRPEAGDKAAALAVESFADMLAEVRKYGTGLIIADQIPAKLIPDVIKNTHCKIVHRLFAEDDRRAMGEAMMMDEEQRNFLPNLQTGEAIVFCGGWHGACHVAIRNDRAQTDGHVNFNLEEKSVRQLWREGGRYYPHFCQLGWFNTADNPQQSFAEWVRSTRQAQNQFLQCLSHKEKAVVSKDSKQWRRAEGAFARVKKWLHAWAPQVEAFPLTTALAIGEAQDIPAGVAQLAKGWLALLLDANPRAHAEEKDVPPLNTPTERHFLEEQILRLLVLLYSHDTLADFRAAIQERSQRDLMAHIQHLSRFKSI